VRFLGERQHLGRLDPEHPGRVVARSKDAVTDIEMPVASVLGDA
jgi:hypothetical protein